MKYRHDRARGKMITTTKILIAAFVLGISVSVAYTDDEESCTGICMPDGSTVYGTCIDDSFSGYDLTGGTVYGTCSNGTFEGVEEATGAEASGTCTSDPSTFGDR